MAPLSIKRVPIGSVQAIASTTAGGGEGEGITKVLISTTRCTVVHDRVGLWSDTSFGFEFEQ